MFEFIQSVFLKHELTFLIQSCKVFSISFLSREKNKRKAINPDLWAPRTNISPSKGLSYLRQRLLDRRLESVKYPLPPSDPGAISSLNWRASSPAHDRAGAGCTAWHSLAPGLWGNWSNSATGGTVLMSQDRSCA